MTRKILSSRKVFERSISEEDVFGAVRALLELNGARVNRVVERIPWGPKGRKSQAGIPDTFGWWSVQEVYERKSNQFNNYLVPRTQGLAVAIHFYIELKRPFKALYRPAQLQWIDAAQRDGVIAFFADSVESMVAGFARYGIKIKGLQ